MSVERGSPAPSPASGGDGRGRGSIGHARDRDGAPASEAHIVPRMESRAELRKELEEAIAQVRRQIGEQASSIDRLSGTLYPSGDTLAVMALEDELAQLEHALANLDSDGA